MNAELKHMVSDAVLGTGQLFSPKEMCQLLINCGFHEKKFPSQVC